MVVDEDLINKLEDLELNSYEAKIWTSLLSRGVSTAGELSDISGVPRSRAYDVLESLEEKGFVVIKSGKPMKYLAVEPEEVVERMKKQVKKEAEERTEDLEDMKESNLINELDQLYEQGVETLDPTDRSGAFKGRDKVYNHMNKLIKDSEDEVVIMTTTDGLLRKIDRFRYNLEKQAKNGVNVKIGAPLEGDAEELATHLNQNIDNLEIRHTDNTARFCLADGEELLVMLKNDDEIHENYDSAVWFSTDYFSDYFLDLFNKHWDDMQKS